MFWDQLTKIFSYIGITDKTVVQDIILSTILIPIVIGIASFLSKIYFRTRPLRVLLKGFVSKKNKILIFLAQLSASDNNGRIIPNQKYIVKFGKPHPNNKNAVGIELRKNIDPVWAESDGKCLGDVYNILGKVGRVENIEVCDLVDDIGKLSSPIFSIGFNPKTTKLLEDCDPIYFTVDLTKAGFPLIGIKGYGEKFSSILPRDAAIIQKTYIKGTRNPVFILAGLGTMGTSAAGYFFREHAVTLGKLFGNNPFCILLNVRWDEGKESVRICNSFPKPKFYRYMIYPLSVIKFTQNKLFPTYVDSRVDTKPNELIYEKRCPKCDALMQPVNDPDNMLRNILKVSRRKEAFVDVRKGEKTYLYYCENCHDCKICSPDPSSS